MPLDIPICMTESQLAKARGAAHLDDSGPLDHRLNIARDGRYGTPGLPSSQAPVRFHGCRKRLWKRWNLGRWLRWNKAGKRVSLWWQERAIIISRRKGIS